MARRITLEDAKQYSIYINGEQISLKDCTKEQLMISCAEQAELLLMLQNMAGAMYEAVDNWDEADTGTLELIED